MKCPNCGANTQGKFCGECGTRLEVEKCAKCQARLAPAARFCTQCGAAVKGRSSGNMPWLIAGGVLAAAIIVLLIPTLRGGETSSSNAAPTPEAPFAGGGTGTPPPLSANMRENADRLFNRIMQAREAGDSAQVQQFAPMAITAYQNSGELDNDGLYHLSILQTAAHDPAGGRATAEEILRNSPTHLLGLAAAASAAVAQNDSAAARQFYQRWLDAYPAERSRTLPEYQDHQNLFNAIGQEATAYLKK